MKRVYIPYAQTEFVEVSGKRYERKPHELNKFKGAAFECDDDCPMTHESTQAEALTYVAAGQAKTLGPWFRCKDCPYVFLEWEVEPTVLVKTTEFLDEAANTVKVAEVQGYVCPECKYKRATPVAVAKPKLTPKKQAAIEKIVGGVGQEKTEVASA
jgi:rubredoxin